jgi:membrane-associated phospholipid phosphatase
MMSTPCRITDRKRLYVCRFVRLASGDEEKIREGRTSYPSGHAAETTMTFGLLSFYLMAQLHLFTRQSQVRSNSVEQSVEAAAACG